MNAQVRLQSAERAELCNALRFRFGESAPAADVAQQLGLTPRAVCARALALLERQRS
jgi:hypothetical protein